MYKKFNNNIYDGRRMERENPDKYKSQKKDEYLEIESQIWTGCTKGKLVRLYEEDGKGYSRMVIYDTKEEMKQELENKNKYIIWEIH